MALGELLQCNNSVEKFTACCQLKHLLKGAATIAI